MHMRSLYHVPLFLSLTLSLSLSLCVSISLSLCVPFSISLSQLINAMRKKLRVQLAVADLFTAPTIEALATKISLLQILGSPSASNVTASGKPRANNGMYADYIWLIYYVHVCMAHILCTCMYGSYIM